MTACVARLASAWPACPCPPCRHQARRHRKQHSAGIYPRVADSAWTELARLARLGWTSLAVADASGLPWATVQHWMTALSRGQTVRIGEGRARLLLSRGTPTKGRVGAYGSTRRLQGLARHGWDLGSIGELLPDIPYSTLATLRVAGVSSTAAETATAITALTESIGMKPGPSRPARLHAERAGWVGLLAWDDIDDPDERPQVGTDPRWRSKDDVDHAVVARVVNGERLPMTRAERVEVVRRLRDIRGWSEERIEAHTGITQACNRHRYPRPDEEDAA